QELLKRAEAVGKVTQLEHQVPVASLVTKYKIELKAEHFAADPRALVFSDATGRSVAVYQVLLQEEQVRSTQRPFTDVLVVADGAMTLGWLDRRQVTDHDLGFNAHSKSVR